MITGRFTDKVVIVTGGGTGIGAAAARRIASEGGRLVVTGRRAGPVEAVARELGGLAVAGDAMEPGHAKLVVARAIERFGGVDILIANAGAMGFGTAEEADPSDFRAAFDANVQSAANFVKASVPAMRARGGGAIVIVASMAALTAAPRGAPYIVAKSALLGLTRSIAHDFGPENIRCNTVCPGWVRTDMAEGGIASLGEARGLSVDETVEKITRFIPLRRMAAPEELGATIAFLASSDASFITGALLVADGGAAILDAGTLGAFG